MHGEPGRKLCNKDRKARRLATPRTCDICGLGPCARTVKIEAPEVMDDFKHEHAPPDAEELQVSVTPWTPITDVLTLKKIGKLQEELNELGAAVARVLIQGIDEREPTTGKLNRTWLCEEMGDVMAQMELLGEHFNLSTDFIHKRMDKKIKLARIWHGM